MSLILNHEYRTLGDNVRNFVMREFGGKSAQSSRSCYAGQLNILRRSCIYFFYFVLQMKTVHSPYRGRISALSNINGWGVLVVPSHKLPHIPFDLARSSINVSCRSSQIHRDSLLKNECGQHQHLLFRVS